MLVKINSKTHWSNGKLGFLLEQEKEFYTILTEDDGLAFLTRSEFIILDWQPMDSAPKDGTRILIKDTNDNINVYCWGCEDWQDTLEGAFIMFTPKEWKPIC